MVLGLLPNCLPSVKLTAEEWMVIYRREWAAERLLTTDGLRDRPELQIRTF